MEPRHALIHAGFALLGLLQVLLARWLAGKSRDLNGGLMFGAAVVLAALQQAGVFVL